MSQRQTRSNKRSSSAPAKTKKTTPPRDDTPPQRPSATSCLHHLFGASTKTTRHGDVIAATSTCDNCGVVVEVRTVKIEKEKRNDKKKPKGDDFEQEEVSSMSSTVSEPLVTETTKEKGKPPKLAPPTALKRPRDDFGDLESIDSKRRKTGEEVALTEVVLTEAQRAFQEWKSMSQSTHFTPPCFSFFLEALGLAWGLC